MTFAVGEVAEEALRLMRVTEESLEAGIACCHPGRRLHDISAAVQAVVEDAGYSVVREYVGHGIGRNMHEDRRSRTTAKRDGACPPGGMVLAIEPMVNAGGAEVDPWTTADGSHR